MTDSGRGGRAPSKPGCKVFIGGLDERAEKRDIEEFLRDAPPGFAFVEFEDPRDAEDAVKNLNGREVRGRPVKVEVSTGRPKARSGRDEECNICRRVGHFARDCLENRDRRRSRSPPRRRSRSRSPPRRRSRSRSPRRERSRSPRRDRSPVRREERKEERRDERPRSRSRERSPRRDDKPREESKRASSPDRR